MNDYKIKLILKAIANLQNQKKETHQVVVGGIQLYISTENMISALEAQVITLENETN